MNKNKFYRYAFLPVSLLGCVSLGLQLALFSLTETNGLLPRSHPLHLATIGLSGAVIGLVIYLLRANPESSQNSPVSAAGIGAAAAGLAAAAAAFQIYKKAQSGLDLLDCALALVCAVCMLAVSRCRKQHKPAHFLWHVGICVFFAFHMVCQYRGWSSMPQAERYLMPMFACVLLSLSAYYRAAFSLGTCSRKPLDFCVLTAIYFSIAALPAPGNQYFFLAGALWALTCLPTPEENTHVSA